jgi:hypothetical protein
MSGNAVEHYPLVFSRYSLQSALELANRAYQFTSSSIIQARINMMIIWLEYSLDMLYALDKDNKPRCANAIMRLIEDASEKGYPIFDRQMLLKYPFINRLSTDGNINTPK